ncbi:MAG: RNA-binding protein [Rhodoferax sp.]|nr:RNA-binding protein [Rhodoferax sp.]
MVKPASRTLTRSPPPPRTAPQKSPPKAPEGERLSKRVMQLKGCSRTEAEQYIAGGWVTVDGTVVEEPQARVSTQTVALAPDASLLNLMAITILLNKPPNVTAANAHTLLTLETHFSGDTSGTRPLKRHLLKLESHVLLETGASGLMVFSQDWRTTRKLVEDMASMEHELMVEVAGEVDPEALQPIQRALNSDRQALPQAKISVNSTTPERSKLRLAVKGAHPGLAAHLCELAQLEILALRRVRLGRVALGDLPQGQWRYLGAHERF